MSFEFKLPDLGEGMAEVEVISWYVAEGDDVTVDQPLLSVETDKLVTDLPSPVAGRVTELRAAPGDKVPVGQTLVLIDALASSGARVAGEAEQRLSASKPPEPAPSSIRSRSRPRRAAPLRRDARVSAPPRQSASSRSTSASTFLSFPAPDPKAASLATTSLRRRPAPPRRPTVPHDWSLQRQLRHLATEAMGPVRGSPAAAIASPRSDRFRCRRRGARSRATWSSPGPGFPSASISVRSTRAN